MMSNHLILCMYMYTCIYIQTHTHTSIQPEPWLTFKPMETTNPKLLWVFIKHGTYNVQPITSIIQLKLPIRKQKDTMVRLGTPSKLINKVHFQMPN